MKQLHNIVAPLILFCLMAAVSLPVPVSYTHLGDVALSSCTGSYHDGQG